MPAESKPWYKSKSWWVAALSVVGNTTAWAAGAVPGPWALGLGGASVVAYAVAKAIEGRAAAKAE